MQQQFLRGLTVPWKERYPDRNAKTLEGLLSQRNLQIRNSTEDGFCALAGALHSRVGQDDGEFLPAVAACDIFRADICLKDVGERL